jgi:flagellar hook-length control protein FliK
VARVKEAAYRDQVWGFMDNIASMNGFRDDAATSAKTGKNASARRASDQERVKGAFDDLLAGVIAPPAPAVVQPETPKDFEATSTAPSPVSSTTAATQPAEVAAPINGDQVEVSDGVETPTFNGAVAAQVDGDGVLAQLVALGVDEAAPTQTAATPSNVITNAATLSASRSNISAAAALESDTVEGTSTNTTAAATGTPPAASNPVSNDNTAAVSLAKSKPVEVDAIAKAPTQGLEPVSTTNDGAGSTSVIGGQEVATPANDQANRAPQLTTHTIPMLAATMMRRLESGSKQFTMRLDPPELGQVEVKLTVSADKKVRAVVSADRPEALVDLVRSARDLARALQDAGLDLEENGLTFQMNDPSSGQQSGGRDRQSSTSGRTTSALATAAEPDVQTSAALAKTINDPFERWQRARIALTA